jgi:hypothetical protein
MHPLVPPLPGPARPIAPAPIVRLLRREPLAPIREVLAVSIHDVVNDEHVKWTVAELWRITRWIENERWLRRALAER